MSNFTTIETDVLVLVNGGQSRTTESGANVTLPGGTQAGVTHNTTTTEPSRYLRCLDQVNRNAGLFESPNRIEQRQAAQCGPLLQLEQPGG